MFRCLNIAVLILSIVGLIIGCEKNRRDQFTEGDTTKSKERTLTGTVESQQESSPTSESPVLPDEVFSPSPSDLEDPLQITIEKIEAEISADGPTVLEKYKKKVLMLKAPVVGVLIDPLDPENDGLLTLVYHRLPIRQRAIVEFSRGRDQKNLIRRVLSLNISPDAIARTAREKSGIINVQDVHQITDLFIDFVEIPCHFLEYRGFPVFRYVKHVSLTSSDKYGNLPIDFIYGTTNADNFEKLSVNFRSKGFTGIRNRGKNQGSFYTLSGEEHNRACYLRIDTHDLAKILIGGLFSQTFTLTEVLGNVGPICASHSTPEYDNDHLNGLDVRLLEPLLQRIVDGSQYDLFSKGSRELFLTDKRLSDYDKQIIAERSQKLLDKRIPEKLSESVNFLLSFYDSEDFYFDLDEENPQIKVWGE